MTKLLTLTAALLLVGACTQAQLDRFNAATETVVGNTIATCEVGDKPENRVLIELGAAANEDVERAKAEFDANCEALKAAVEAKEEVE